MTDWAHLAWTEHDAAVEPLTWGHRTYTIVRLPAVVVEYAASVGTRRVAGSVDETEVNLGINRADVIPDAFLYCGPPLLRRLGVRVGDGVRLRLRPADPDLVPVPTDVRRALVEAGAWESFESCRAPERRRMLQPIESAAAPATRERRIGALLRALG